MKKTEEKTDYRQRQTQDFLAGFVAGLAVVGVPCAILLLFVIF